MVAYYVKDSHTRIAMDKQVLTRWKHLMSSRLKQVARKLLVNSLV